VTRRDELLLAIAHGVRKIAAATAALNGATTK